MWNHVRYPLAKVSSYGITHLKQHNPYMIAWWSAIFPGFGHYLLNQYIRATFLTLSEVLLNTLAHVNEAMMYTFCGQFEIAKSFVEPRWAFGYLTIYLIAISDSFRTAIYQNKIFHLAKFEQQQVPVLKITSSEIQFLERKNPFIGVVHSFFFPGLGQFYNRRFGLAFYAMLWWFIYLTLSGMHESFLFLVHGHLSKSTSILLPHWLLFMPSVMCGSMYHAYRSTVEHNQLYRSEQRHYLMNKYQNSKVRIFR